MDSWRWKRAPGGLTLGDSDTGGQAAVAGRYGDWHWTAERILGDHVSRERLRGCAATKADAMSAAEASAESITE